MIDSFPTRDILTVNGIDYTIFSLAKLGQRFDLARLPLTLRVSRVEKESFIGYS